MTCFAPSLARPAAAAQDPTKRVNYVLGMVLGVDDLVQESTYFLQRDQWMARDLCGYGTVWGLAVSERDGGTRGPEVAVSSGVAINPRGQIIRVAPAQCAALDEWLASRGDDILARRIATANPNLFQLQLCLVLSYRTCLTDPVPIAGEPCRSEDDSTAPSRIADDFLLELQFDAPAQTEEDSIREFVRWLREHVTVTGGGAPSLTVPQFLDGIRAAAAAAAQADASPPSPPGGQAYLLDTSPPTLLSVPSALLPDYLRAAARLWVTELRPSWRPDWLGDLHACAGNGALASPDQGNQVLLAKLILTIGPAALNSSTWTVQGPLVIDEDDRPFLLSVRLLQEQLLTGAGGAAVGPGSGSTLVAAGVISGDGTPNGRTALGHVRVVSHANVAAATQLHITFDGYATPPAAGGLQYVIKVLPWTALHLTCSVLAFEAGGFVVSLSKSGKSLTAGDLSGLSLFVEVTQLA